MVVIEVGDGENDEGQDPDNHIMDVLCTLNSQKNISEIATGTVVWFLIRSLQ